MTTIGVIGLGQLGTAVGTHLAANGAEVIAIDSSLTRVEAIKDEVTRALCLDCTDEKALRAAGLSECAFVVLALGEGQLEEAVLTTMILRKLAVGKIISRASTEVQKEVLERLGVSRVVFPERSMGVQIARQILAPGLHEIVPLSIGSSLAEVSVPRPYIGKTLGDVGLRPKFGLNAVALKRPQESVSDTGEVTTDWAIDNAPAGDTMLESGDILVVVGTDANVRSFVEG